MDFSWTRKQEELKKAVINFAVKKLNNGLIERDRRSEFSLDGWKHCADFGILGLPIPCKYGGSALDPLTIVYIMEGFGYGCQDSGLSFSVNAHIWSCEIPVFIFGSEEQKKKFLPRFCNGQNIGAAGITEPEAGSDVCSLKANAVKRGDYYILNGTKTLVTNANVANKFLIYVTTDKTKGFMGISCFIVEKGTPGLIINKNIERMGLRTSDMGEIVLQDCRVSVKNLLGGEGVGMAIFNDAMERERIYIMATNMGIMERQLEACVKYARQRKQFNSPIGKFQSISHRIANMKVRLETARYLLYKAAWLKRKKKNCSTETAIIKLYISEAYVQNSLDALQIHGGYGYATELGLERELRNAVASTIYSGTSEMQKNIIAGTIGL